MNRKLLVLNLVLIFCLTGIFAQNHEISDELAKIKAYSKHQQDVNYHPKQQHVNQQRDYQSPAWGSVGHFGQTGADPGRFVEIDGSGNTIVVGTFTGEFNIAGRVMDAADRMDIFIVKYNSLGDTLWTKHLITGGADVIIDELRIATNNQVYLTGNYRGQGSGVFATAPAMDELGVAFLLQYSIDGELLNDKTVQLDISHIETSIAISTDSKIVWVHKYGDVESKVMVLDSDYALLTQQTFEVSISKVMVNNSIIYFFGKFNKNTQLGNLDLVLNSTNYEQIFFAAADLELNFDWVKYPEVFVGANGDSRSIDALMGADDKIYAIAHVRGAIQFDANNMFQVSNEHFMIKISLDGNYEWFQNVYGLTSPKVAVSDKFYLLAKAINPLHIANNLIADAGNYVVSLDLSTGAYLNNIESDKYPYDIAANNTNLALTGYKFGSKNFFVDNFNTADYSENYSLSATSNNGEMHLSGIEVTSQASKFIVGTYVGSMDFYGTELSEESQTNFVAKINKDDNLEWIHQVPGSMPYNDIERIIYVNPEESHIAVALPYIGDFTFGGQTFSSSVTQNLIALIDIDGNIKWVKDITGLESIYINVDNEENIALSGDFDTEVVIESTTITSIGGLDVAIARFNVNGELQWMRSYGGNSEEYVAISAIDNSGNTYVTGEFTSEVITDDLGNETTLNEGDGNVAFIKLASDGSQTFFKTIAGSGDPTNYNDNYCWPTAIETTEEGVSYITGWMGTKAFFDDIELASDKGYYHHFVTQLDNAGNVNWAKIIEQKQFGFDYNEATLDDAGNFYVMSRMRDTVWFEGNTHFETIDFNEEWYIASYNNSGTLNWVKNWPHGGNSFLKGIDAHAVNSVFVVGSSFGYVTFDDIEYTSSGRHGFVALLGQEINFPPTDISLSQTSVDENVAIETVVGEFTTTDQNANDSFSYTFATGDGTNDADNDNFKISNNQLLTNTELDYETQAEHKIFVQVTDAADASFQKAFTITVNNLDENNAPTDITLSANQIAEDATVGTTVGSFSATDADEDDTFTFELTSGDGTNDADNANFVVSGADLNTSVGLDFETQETHNIFVKVTDAAGASFEKAFTIAVTDVDETGIKNLALAGVRIYPNPVYETLTIESENHNLVSIKLTNALGQNVLSTSFKNGNKNLNLSMLSPGVYYLQIEKNSKRIQTQIVVK